MFYRNSMKTFWFQMRFYGKWRLLIRYFFPFFFLLFFLEALLHLFAFFLFIYFYFLGLNLECKSALELVPHDRNLNHQVQRVHFKVLGYSILLRGPIIFQFWLPTSSFPRSYWMPPFGNVLVIHLQGVPSIFLPIYRVVCQWCTVAYPSERLPTNRLDIGWKCL